MLLFFLVIIYSIYMANICFANLERENVDTRISDCNSLTLTRSYFLTLSHQTLVNAILKFFLFKTIFWSIQIVQAGATGLIFQSSLLITAVVVLWSGLHLGNATLLFFLFLVVFLRRVVLLLVVLRFAGFFLVVLFFLVVFLFLGAAFFLVALFFFLGIFLKLSI